MSIICNTHTEKSSMTMKAENSAAVMFLKFYHTNNCVGALAQQ